MSNLQFSKGTGIGLWMLDRLERIAEARLEVPTCESQVLDI